MPGVIQSVFKVGPVILIMINLQRFHRFGYLSDLIARRNKMFTKIEESVHKSLSYKFYMIQRTDGRKVCRERSCDRSTLSPTDVFYIILSDIKYDSNSSPVTSM